MGKVRVAFDVLGRHGDKPPVGHIYIGVHMTFDIEMENFQFKARLVANGNATCMPASLTYASVVQGISEDRPCDCRIKLSGSEDF